jgi:hypothetical protein
MSIDVAEVMIFKTNRNIGCWTSNPKAIIIRKY